MNERFIDTSGWGHFLIESEPHHEAAVSWMRQWHAAGGGVITTNYVLAELVALLTSPLRIPRVTQIPVLRAIRSAAWLQIVHVDAALDATAWTLFDARPDKEWSLADCVSFAVMQDRGIREALTTDHHFEQAGFVRLLVRS